MSDSIIQHETPSGQRPDPEFPRAIVLKDAGDDAQGVLERYSEGPSKFDPNQSVAIAVIRKDDGQLGSVWLNVAVQRSEFARLRPEPGERVEIVCKGMREGENGSYRDFEVAMPDRKPFVPDWDSMDAGEDWGAI